MKITKVKMPEIFDKKMAKLQEFYDDITKLTNE